MLLIIEELLVRKQKTKNKMDKKEIENLRKKLLEQIEQLPEEQAKSLREQIKNASTEQLETFVKAQMQMQSQKGQQGKQGKGEQGQGECFFCQLISGKIETTKIYEDNDILAILDIYPANLGHLIIMPKKHFQFIYEIPDAILKKIFVFAKIIEPIIMETTKAQGISIYIAQGQIAGQTVSHFSVNLIPRFEKDNVNLMWQKKKPTKKELEKLGEKIRKKAEKVVTENFEQERKKTDKKQKKKDSSEAQEIIKHIKKRIP